MTDNDTFEYNARELAKARPYSEYPGSPHRLKAEGPGGASEWLYITAAQYARVVDALTTDPGITYRVQAHDITTLTWPMWEACGIECPKMIGADCPRGISTGEDCPGWSAKFPSAAAEVVHAWSLDSDPETVGDVDQPIGWNALFRTTGEDDDTDTPTGAGVILHTDSQGFVSLVRYGTATELDGIWSMLQDEEAEFERANCPQCIEGQDCDERDEDED